MRERVLEAAAAVFAEQGFRHGTVREIARLADVNIAAVNYYFGNKEQLYLKVVEHWMDIAFADYPIAVTSDESLPLETKLEAFVGFMVVLLKESPWFGRLVLRESSFEPTAALDMVVEEDISPANVDLFNIVRALLGKGFDESEVRLYSASIVGQCSYFYICRPIVDRIFPLEGDDEVRLLTRHITAFSLGALAEARRRRAAGDAPPLPAPSQRRFV